MFWWNILFLWSYLFYRRAICRQILLWLWLSRARNCKRLRSPGIDSLESIPPASVAGRYVKYGCRTCPSGWESIPNIVNCESTFIKSEQVTDSCRPCALLIWWDYSGRTKYSACASKPIKLAVEYLRTQKTQRSAVFFIRQNLGRKMISNFNKCKFLKDFHKKCIEFAYKKTWTI